MTTVAPPAPVRSTPRLRRQAMEMTGANALQRGTGAIGGVIAARLLGPAGRGEYAIIVLVGSAASLILAAGLQFWVAARLAVQPHADDVRSVLRRHAVLTGALLAAGGAVAALFLPRGTHGSALVVVGLAAASAAATIVLAVPMGLRRTRRAAVAMGAGGIGWLGWLGLAAAVGWRTPAGIALGAAVSQLAVVAVCGGLLWRLPRRTLDGASPNHGAVVRAHLAPGLGEVVLLSAFRIDIALTALLASPAAAGLYAVATSVAEGLWLLPDAVASVLLPQVAAHANTDVRRVRAWAMGVTAAVALPLILLRVPLITTVFGEPYRPAATALPWLVLATLFLSAWKVDSAALVARGKGSARLISASGALVVLVAGDLLLIPHLGIRGAALSCAAAYGSAAVLAARVADR